MTTISVDTYIYILYRYKKGLVQWAKRTKKETDLEMWTKKFPRFQTNEFEKTASLWPHTKWDEKSFHAILTI